MQDREPTYPGRVTLTPVYGLANTYDMERADRPLQEGTPLNKANLLKDATAALFGLGTDAVPDDALHLLSRFQSGLGNEYVWEKINREIKDAYDETVYTDSSTPFMQPSGSSSYTMSYGDSYTINKNGSVTLTGETGSFTLNAPFNPDKFEILKGKWFRDPQIDNKIIYLPADTTITQTTDTGTSYLVNMRSSNGWTSRKNFKKDVIFDTILGYVNAPNPNVYPPTVDDGYIYNPLGQLGDKVRIATGSYKGTGTYGSSHPNSLTFAFEPAVLLVSSPSNYGLEGFGYDSSSNVTYAMIGSVLTTSYKQYFGIGVNTNATGYGKKSSDGKKFSWYNKASAENQWNASNKVYHYIAIG